MGDKAPQGRHPVGRQIPHGITIVLWDDSSPLGGHRNELGKTLNTPTQHQPKLALLTR